LARAAQDALLFTSEFVVTDLTELMSLDKTFQLGVPIDLVWPLTRVRACPV
jgi:hypothetical protein